ncbi:MAG: hypothetical protein RL637_419 [Pseudomonadota bacterium]|jgi:hypothetical protein
MKAKIYAYWLQLKNSPGADTPLVRWGLFLSMAIVFESYIIEPYFEWRQQQIHHIQIQSRQIASLTALQKSMQQWQQALQLTHQPLSEQQQAFIQANSHTLAQQKLANELQNLIAQHQLKLISQRLLEIKSLAISDQIGLQLEIGGQLLAIIEFIDSIAHHQTAFTVDYLQLSQTQNEAFLKMSIYSYRLK